MPRCTSINNNQRFETFEIENKIQEFEKMLLTQKIDFKSKDVVLVTPRLDNHRRMIYKEDGVLFDRQNRDAHMLANHMVYNLNANSVTLPIDCTRGRARKDMDYLILLHEFVDDEKNHILTKLTQTNENLTYFEIY